MFKSLKGSSQGVTAVADLSPEQVLESIDFSAGLGEVASAQTEAAQSRRVVQYLKDGGSAEAVVALYAPASGPTPALEAFQDGSAAALIDLFEQNAAASDVAATEGLKQWARRNRKKVSVLLGVLATIATYKLGHGSTLAGAAVGIATGTYLIATKNASDPCPASRQDFDEAFARIRAAVEVVKHITADVTKKDDASIPERVVFHQCDFGKSGLNTTAAYKTLTDELQSSAKTALDALTAAEHKFGAMTDPVPSEVAAQYASAVSAISESIGEARAQVATIGQKFFTKSKDQATK